MASEIICTWTELKEYAQARSRAILYVERSQDYLIRCEREPIVLECQIMKTTPPSQDQTDFETNFKT